MSRRAGCRKVFVDPADPDKARALGWAAPDTAVRLEWLKGPASQLLTVHGVRVRGWRGVLRVVGPPELLRVGYEAGLGERNAQGFGMVGPASMLPGP